jgi:Transposase IS66 family
MVSRPLIVQLEAWVREQRAKFSRSSDTTKAINYGLNRWDAFTRFLDDRRPCMSNNAARSHSSGYCYLTAVWCGAPFIFESRQCHRSQF